MKLTTIYGAMMKRAADEQQGDIGNNPTVATLRSAKVRAERERDELKKSLQDTQSKLQEAEARVENVRAGEQHKSQIIINSYKKNEERLKQQIADLESINNFTGDAGSVRAQIDTITGLNESLQGQLDTASNMLDAVAEENKDLTRTRDALRTDLGAEKERSKALAGEGMFGGFKRRLGNSLKHAEGEWNALGRGGQLGLVGGGVGGAALGAGSAYILQRMLGMKRRGRTWMSLLGGLAGGVGGGFAGAQYGKKYS